MNLEKLRKHCLSFHGASEQIQWGADLVFKVSGNVRAATEPSGHVLSFKCSDEDFAQLLERDGIVPLTEEGASGPNRSILRYGLIAVIADPVPLGV